MKDIENFGKDLSDFLRGFLGESYNNYESDGDSIDYSKGFPKDYEIWGDFNNAAVLQSGHLLVVHLTTNRCYMVNPENGEVTFLFSLNWGPKTFFWRAIANPNGNIYCTVSGTISSMSGKIPPGYHAPGAKFRYWGAILEVNVRDGSIKVIGETKVPGKGEILDPHGFQILKNGNLLICDYQGFGSGGCIYELDLHGNLEVIHRTGSTPVNAFFDDGIIWIANAKMDTNDGEIIKFDTNTGKEEVFVPARGFDEGCVVGISASNNSNELILYRCAWPNLNGKSGISILNKESGIVEDIIESSVEDPMFPNTTGAVKDNILWYGECVKKEIIGFDLKKRKIHKKIDFKNIAGGWNGMIDSYDSIESISIIPSKIGQI
ncbi:hypothetical protein [Flagellimonas sp.]|uniref:hypothetical protein n=1 Tax=Flagellimonas sp. TaxID=2058762 RepID=UPI003F4A0CDE